MDSTFSFNFPRPQIFSIHPNIIIYLIHNCASPILYIKLIQTCKYFFARKKVLVLDGQVQPESCMYLLKRSNGTTEFIKFRKGFRYWLAIRNFHYFGGERFLKNIYRCDLIILRIRYAELTFEEISFLMNGGNLENLSLISASIKHLDGTPATMDEVLIQCPKLARLDYSNYCEIFSSTTFENVNKLSFNKKWTSFNLKISKTHGEIDPMVFCDFLKKTVVPPPNISRVSTMLKMPKKDYDNFCSAVRNLLGEPFRHIYFSRRYCPGFDY